MPPHNGARGAPAAGLEPGPLPRPLPRREQPPPTMTPPLQQHKLPPQQALAHARSAREAAGQC